ncbi:MAG TPA: trimethylamine methyltransferase family protein, partial [Anaerolineae bacterium]|nr:trimethylamine methyltransferase family protein [Anaerolineae bacterium]
MRPQLQILTPQQIDAILADAKRILAEVGIEVRGPALRQRLLDAGLPLDATGQRVLFPPDVVDRALLSAPRSITLYDRAGQP